MLGCRTAPVGMYATNGNRKTVLEHACPKRLEKMTVRKGPNLIL